MAIGATVGMLLLTLSCGREVTGPPGGARTSASVAFLAQFPQLPGQAALGSGVEYARLRATLLRLGGEVATDRTVAFPSDVDSLALSLSATFGPGATEEGEEMVLLLRFITASGDTVFRSGPDTIFVEAARVGTAPAPVVVEPVYVGPGAEATRVQLSSTDVTVVGAAGAAFAALAFDAQDAPVPDAPILFSSSDTSLVRFADARSGVATTVARRDSALVFATLLSGASDSAVVRVTLPAAAIAAVSGNAQSATAGTALAAPVRVRVTASDALPVEGVSVTFGVVEGAVGAATVLTDVSGEASTSWTLGPSVGTQTLTATVDGLAGSPVSFTATATSGAAVALEFTTGPVSAVAGLSLGSITVTARDGQSNVATAFTDSVTLSIDTNVGGGVLGGVRTVAAVAGVAVFTGLTIDRAGSGYTLAASASGLSGATSDAFDITPAAALSLAFVVQPPSVAVNAILAPAVQVEARDAFGNRATGYTGDVTMALGDNPGGAVLGGTLVVAAVDGLATFSDLTVDAIAAGYTLEATAVALTAATSAPFNTVAELIAWTNASGGLWSNPANWSLGRVPAATDSVVIALDGTYTVTMDVDFTGSHLTLGAATGTQTLALSGRTLTLAGVLQTQAGGGLSANNSTVGGTGSLHNSGSVYLRDSNVALSLANDGLAVVNGGVTVIGGLTTTTASVLRMLPDGSTGTSTLTVASGFNNLGLIELTASVGAYASALAVSAGTLTNAASGVIRSDVGTGGSRTLHAAVTNLGVIDIDQPLTWNGVSVAQVNDGSITVDANLTISQTGTAPSFANSGAITIAGAATLSVIGGAFTQTPTSIGGTGILAFTAVSLALPSAFATGALTTWLVNTTVTGAGSLTNEVGRTLNMRGTALSLPLINDGLILLDGNNTFSGSVAASPGSTLRFAASGSTGFAALSTVGFTNHGEIELSSTTSSYSATLVVASGTLVNSPSGGIRSVVGTGGARTLEGSVDNQGLIEVQQPLQWNANNTLISNSGTLDVSGANLTIAQSGSASFATSGTVNIGTARTLLISGGSIAQDGGVYTGAGALGFLNVTVGGSGALTIPSTRSLAMRGVTVTVPLVNEGLLEVDGPNALQGSVTAAVGSTIRVMPTGSTGNSTLTVATGFSNFGLIELTSSVSSYTAVLSVGAGTLTNEASGVIRSAVGTGGARTLNAAVANLGVIDIQQPLAWNGVSVAQVSDGSITVDANLTITQTGTAPSFANNGSITIAAAATMLVNGGTFTQTPTSIGGTGLLAFSGATLELPTAFITENLTTSLLNTTVNGAGSFTNSDPQTMSIRGSTISLPFVNEGLLLSDGTNTISGSIATLSSSIIRLLPTGATGSTNLTVAGFTNAGSIELTASVSSYSSQLTIASGTLVNAASGSISVLPGTGGARTLVGAVDNQGSISVDHPLAWTAADANITNSGTLSVTNGNLSIAQSGTSLFTLAGTVDIDAARALTISGGSFTQASGGFVGTGALNLTNVSVTGPGTLINPATRTLNLRSTTISAPFTNAGVLNVIQSSAIGGALSTVGGSTIRIAADGSAGLSSLTVSDGFTNEGDIELTATVSTYTSVLTVSSGTLTNAPGATISTLPGSGGARTIEAQIDNQGTIAIEHPTVWTATSVANQNNGVLDVNGGNLTINQSGGASFTSDGNVQVAAGRILRISGGTYEETGGGFSGSGEFDLQAGTVLGSALTIPAGFSMRLRQATIDAALFNDGLVWVSSSSALNGGLTTSPGSTLRIASDGSVITTVLSVPSSVVNAGTIELSATVSSYNAILDLGVNTLTNAAGGLITIPSATGGSRSIVASVVNQGQLAISADGSNTLGITGSLTNSGTIAMDLGGLSPGSQYDQISVSGLILLGGTLDVTLRGAFVPVSTNSFTLLQSGTAVTGTFALSNLASPLSPTPTYGATTVTVGVP